MPEEPGAPERRDVMADARAAAESAGLPTEHAAGPETTLAGKIAAAMLEADKVTKDRENKDQHYKFASAEDILAAVRMPLLRRGIALLPSVTAVRETDITSKSGTKGSRVQIDVTFRFTDGSDELEMQWTGEGQDYGDKAIGKAYTNAVKTFIRTAWLLPTEHDDPEASPSGERVSNDLPYGPAVAPETNTALSTRLMLAVDQDADRAKALYTELRNSFGYLPEIVATSIDALLRGIAGEPPAAPAAGADEASADAPASAATEVPVDGPDEL